MSEKEEVLKQINEIKSHLIDRQSFFPYDYNACYVWSIIGLILTLAMPLFYGYGVLMGSGAVATLLGFGFMVEGIMIKKINQSYDIEQYTSRQEFISKTFMLITFFLIALSSSLAIYHLYIPIYLCWLALISFGYYLIGFIINVKNFRLMGQFNIVVAILLLFIAIFLNQLEGIDSIFFRVIQGVLIFGLTILPTVIAWQLKQEEACSV